MPDEVRRTLISRADRMLRQSKTLRKMSEELLQESKDVRGTVKKLKVKRTKAKD
jgi:hypothetical protein